MKTYYKTCPFCNQDFTYQAKDVSMAWFISELPSNGSEFSVVKVKCPHCEKKARWKEEYDPDFYKPYLTVIDETPQEMYCNITTYYSKGYFY